MSESEAIAAIRKQCDEIVFTAETLNRNNVLLHPKVGDPMNRDLDKARMILDILNADVPCNWRGEDNDGWIRHCVLSKGHDGLCRWKLPDCPAGHGSQCCGNVRFCSDAIFGGKGDR